MLCTHPFPGYVRIKKCEGVFLMFYERQVRGAFSTAPQVLPIIISFIPIPSLLSMPDLLQHVYKH
jgi:hypothetical protein